MNEYRYRPSFFRQAWRNRFRYSCRSSWWDSFKKMSRVFSGIFYEFLLSFQPNCLLGSLRIPSDILYGIFQKLPKGFLQVLLKKILKGLFQLFLPAFKDSCRDYFTDSIRYSFKDFCRNIIQRICEDFFTYTCSSSYSLKNFIFIGSFRDCFRDFSSMFLWFFQGFLQGLRSEYLEPIIPSVRRGFL